MPCTTAAAAAPSSAAAARETPDFFSNCNEESYSTSFCRNVPKRLLSVAATLLLVGHSLLDYPGCPILRSSLPHTSSSSSSMATACTTQGCFTSVNLRKESIRHFGPLMYASAGALRAKQPFSSNSRQGLSPEVEVEFDTLGGQPLQFGDTPSADEVVPVLSPQGQPTGLFAPRTTHGEEAVSYILLPESDNRQHQAPRTLPTEQQQEQLFAVEQRKYEEAVSPTLPLWENGIWGPHTPQSQLQRFQQGPHPLVAEVGPGALQTDHQINQTERWRLPKASAQHVLYERPPTYRQTPHIKWSMPYAEEHSKKVWKRTHLSEERPSTGYKLKKHWQLPWPKNFARRERWLHGQSDRAAIMRRSVGEESEPESLTYGYIEDSLSFEDVDDYGFAGTRQYKSLEREAQRARPAQQLRKKVKAEEVAQYSRGAPTTAVRQSEVSTNGKKKPQAKSEPDAEEEARSTKHIEKLASELLKRLKLPCGGATINKAPTHPSQPLMHQHIQPITEQSLFVPQPSPPVYRVSPIYGRQWGSHPMLLHPGRVWPEHYGLPLQLSEAIPHEALPELLAPHKGVQRAMLPQSYPYAGVRSDASLTKKLNDITGALKGWAERQEKKHHRPKHLHRGRDTLKRKRGRERVSLINTVAAAVLLITAAVVVLDSEAAARVRKRISDMLPEKKTADEELKTVPETKTDHEMTLEVDVPEQQPEPLLKREQPTFSKGKKLLTYTVALSILLGIGYWLSVVAYDGRLLRDLMLHYIKNDTVYTSEPTGRNQTDLKAKLRS